MPRTLRGWLPLPWSVDVAACYGGRKITLVGYTAPPWGIGGLSTRVKPAWLGDAVIGAGSVGVTLHPDSVSLREPGFFVAIRPGSGLRLPRGRWVRVTGMFDHPASRSCHGGLPKDDPAYQPPVEVCRRQFVLLSVRVIAVPDTATASPVRGPPDHVRLLAIATAGAAGLLLMIPMSARSRSRRRQDK